jgi:hypothetical protein
MSSEQENHKKTESLLRKKEKKNKFFLFFEKRKIESALIQDGCLLWGARAIVSGMCRSDGCTQMLCSHTGCNVIDC